MLPPFASSVLYVVDIEIFKKDLYLETKRVIYIHMKCVIVSNYFGTCKMWLSFFPLKNKLPGARPHLALSYVYKIYWWKLCTKNMRHQACNWINCQCPYTLLPWRCTGLLSLEIFNCSSDRSRFCFFAFLCQVHVRRLPDINM